MHTFLGFAVDPVAVVSTGVATLVSACFLAVALRQKRREHAWRSALELFAADLNLPPEPGQRNAFVGEVQCERLWVGLLLKRPGSRNTAYVPTLRLDVGAGLPRDFVAVTRTWHDALLSGVLPGIFTAEDPVLDKRFVFQCEDLARARPLVRHPAVRDSLSRLGGGQAAACIEKNQVCLRFTADVPGTDVLHAHLEAMRAVARALRGA